MILLPNLSNDDITARVTMLGFHKLVFDSDHDHDACLLQKCQIMPQFSWGLAVNFTLFVRCATW